MKIKFPKSIFPEYKTTLCHFCFLLLVCLLNSSVNAKFKFNKAMQKQHTTWIGTVIINDTILYAKLYLSKDSGRLVIPQKGIVVTNFKNIKLGNTLSFEAGQGAINFTGYNNADSLWGKITVNGKKGKLQLKPYSPLHKNDLGELEGLYKLASGELISATPFSDGIEFVNYSSGEYTQCWQSPIKQGYFFQVLPLRQDFKKQASTFFEIKISGKNISITKYGCFSNTKQISHGKKITPYKEQQVYFTNDNLKISGILTTPNSGSKKAPLVIIIPGSGDFLTKTLYSRIINFFAANGLSVFSYDKRGMGESTGDFSTASIYDFSDDIMASIKGLLKENNFDTSRIILWGHSQGGWIAPIIANRCKNVVGIISVSGPTDKPGVQTTYWTENSLRTLNYSKTDIKEAVDWMHIITNVMDAHGEGYEVIEKKLPEIKTKNWQDYVTVPESKESLLNWGGYYYDPIPELMKLKIPMLAIYGGLDINVNGNSNSKKMNEIFKLSGIVKSKAIVFPYADHDIVLSKTGNRDLEERYQSKYAPGYFKLMAEWLEKILKTK